MNEEIKIVDSFGDEVFNIAQDLMKRSVLVCHKINSTHRGSFWVEFTEEDSADFKNPDAWKDNLGATYVEGKVFVLDLHEIIYIVYQPGQSTLAMKCAWEQYKATSIGAEGQFLCDQDSMGMAELLTVTEQPFLGFKFVPFDETDDRHFQLAGWESKAAFLEEHGGFSSEEELNKMAWPIGGMEVGQMTELLSEEDGKHIWKYSRSVFDRPIMFIHGSPQSIISPIEGIQEYFEELSFHEEEELREALEAAGLEYIDEE